MGIEQEAEAQGYDLLLFTSASAESKQRRVYREGVNRLQLADGAILLGQEQEKRELEQLSQDGYPFVFVGRRELSGTEISYVAAGYAQATAQVVSHLAGLGHRHVLYLGSTSYRESVQDRERGFRQAMQQLSTGVLEGHIMHLEPNEVSAERLKTWLEQGATAFMVENDLIATTLERAADNLGVSIPQTFSFAVLGDPLEPTGDVPNWTMFTIPRVEMGRESVRLLFELLVSGEGGLQRETLPCTFVPGRSTGLPARR